MSACRLCCRIRHPHAPGTCIAPPGRRCEIRRVPVYPGGNASASVLEGQGSPRNINSISLTGGRLSLFFEEWPSVVSPRVGWCTKARGATAVQGTGALMRRGIGVHWLVGIGGYWWVLGVLAPPAALTTIKVRQEIARIAKLSALVCAVACRPGGYWGGSAKCIIRLGRERTRSEQHRGTVFVHVLQDFARTRFHARCGARGVAAQESTEPPPAQCGGNSHGHLYDSCTRHA